MLFKKKKPLVIPTLADQLANANVAASVHLSAFEVAAKGLEDTADHLDAVRDEASAEATRLYSVKIEADSAAFKHREQAQKIRDLIS